MLIGLSGNAAQHSGGQTADSLRYELPKTTAKDQIVRHTGYTLSYSEPNEQALWVAYELTREHATSTHERTNKFLEDPLVTTGSATNADYAKSGYDRGHLAPAADMGWSTITMKESFYFSNMSPQEPSFNRGIWKRLEEQVRQWAKDNELVYVVTGPVLTHSPFEHIGISNVSVPKYYYKVILDYTEPEVKAIGFILPNASSTLPLKHFAVSVDSVEKVTGIDFFYQLPHAVERKLESKVDVALWSWETVKGDKGKSHKSKSSSNARE